MATDKLLTITDAGLTANDPYYVIVTDGENSG